MTGDEARDFVEELAKWDCEVSGRVFEEFIEEAKKLLDSSRISRPKPISAPPLSEHGAWVSNLNAEEIKRMRKLTGTWSVAKSDAKPTDPWGAPTDTRGYPKK